MREDLDVLAHNLGNAETQTYAYVRVSSSKQEQGLSIDAQSDKIREYCSHNALGEPFIVTEVGSAGKRMFALPSVDDEGGTDETESRPRLHLLLGHLSVRKDTNLVVWRIDRLARLNDEREILYQLLLRFGCTLHSTDVSESTWLDKGDMRDPMTALMRQVFGAFSQYEKAIIEMRMTAGLRYKAAKGGFTGGKAPFGYDIVDGELKINPEERAKVRYIFMLRHKYGYTLRSIAEVMEGMNRSRIHRILKAEGVYRGTYVDRYQQKHNRPDLKILDDDEDYNYEQEFR